MKALRIGVLVLFSGLMITACQKDTADLPNEPDGQSQEFTIPDIPADIAARMSAEDLAKFRAGPGGALLNQVQFRHGRWHPVLMLLGYDLQFVPIGGASCEPGQFQPCFGPGAPVDPTECLASVVGATGRTVADGYWFRNPVHSEYYPVFCASDYSGYGSGFYAVNGDLLWLGAQNTAFYFDREGNSTFRRFGHYAGSRSTGQFAGALGWEEAAMYTAAENNPSNDPNGIGYSDVLIFGWGYW